MSATLQPAQPLVAVLLEAPAVARPAVDHGPAHDPDYLLPVAHRALPCPSQAGALHLPDLAVCLGDGSCGVRHAGGVPLMATRQMTMRLHNDTRKLLAAGSALFLTGAIAALLIFTSFG